MQIFFQSKNVLDSCENSPKHELRTTRQTTSLCVSVNGVFESQPRKPSLDLWGGGGKHTDDLSNLTAHSRIACGNEMEWREIPHIPIES